MGCLAYSALGSICLFWCVGIPLSYYLGISKEYGVAGLAFGIGVPPILLNVVNFYIVHYLRDWKDVADKAVVRIAREADELRNY